jgi:hypothetical protein
MYFFLHNDFSADIRKCTREDPESVHSEIIKQINCDKYETWNLKIR